LFSYIVLYYPIDIILNFDIVNPESEKINMDNKKEKNPAHDWPTYIKQAIKTGLESPIPYKVIPYKNGIGIKKIEFFKPIKNGSL